MNYRLIAVDMDGTLLNEEKQVSARNKKVIEKLADQGVNFILASGRPYQSLHPYTKELEVYLPLISTNGSIIRCALTDKVYHNSAMSRELAREVIDYGLENDYAVSLYFPKKIVTFDEELAREHLKSEGVKAEVVDKVDLDEGTPNKVIYIGTPKRVKEAFSYLSSKYEDELYITQAEENCVEAHNLEVSKGKALEYMMERMNVPADQVMAIGNNYNDIAMFEAAGFAVAMENSPEEVKAEADFVTKTNEEDGVAYALEELVRI